MPSSWAAKAARPGRPIARRSRIGPWTMAEDVDVEPSGRQRTPRGVRTRHSETSRELFRLRAGRPYVLELSHVSVRIRRIMSHPIDADDRVSQVTVLIKLNRALYRHQVRRLDSGVNVGAVDELTTLDNSRNCINHYQRRIVRGQMVALGCWCQRSANRRARACPAGVSKTCGAAEFANQPSQGNRPLLESPLRRCHPRHPLEPCLAGCRTPAWPA